MKNPERLFAVLFVAIALCTTGCPEVGGSKENSPPEIPWGPVPADGALNQELDLTLTWKCDDPDGDLVLFDIYFGPENPPPLVQSKTLMKSFQVSGLKPNHTYYWRVKADDLKTDAVEGPLWSFTTGDEGLALVGSHPPLDRADDVYVFENMAYVADGKYGGLQVIDVSDPAEPVQIAEAASLGSAEGLYVTLIDNTPHVFLAEGSAGLTVFDVSSPTIPYLSGNIDVEDNVKAVKVKNTTAFLAATENMIVVDVSDPSDPVEIGRRSIPGSGLAITIAGDMAYVGTQSQGIQVLGISNPSNPIFQHGYGSEASITGLSTAGNVLYAANEENGLLILDISVTPFEKFALLPTPGIASDVYALGTTVLIADYNSILVVDASKPEDPKVVGRYRGLDFVTSIHALDAEIIYAADLEAGLLIFEPTQ